MPYGAQIERRELAEGLFSLLVKVAEKYRINGVDSSTVDSGYSRSMPADWFELDVTELVSCSILSEVAEFWTRQSESNVARPSCIIQSLRLLQ